MSHVYATDWHQCRTCGCKRPDKEMQKLRLHDDVLKLNEEYFRCTDTVLCVRLKLGREEMLARELGLTPIGEHPQSRKAK